MLMRMIGCSGRTRFGAIVMATAGLLMILPVGPTLHAQDDWTLSEEFGSTYARLRFVEGHITVRRVQEGLVVEAADLNTPLAPGDVIETSGGRAEISLADGSTVWLDDASRLELRTLADLDSRYERTNLLVLDRGTLRVDVEEAYDKGRAFRVDTEGGSVQFLSAGSFRVDADGPVTTVSSFRGVAEVMADAGNVLVRTGERSTVRPGRIPSSPRPFNTARLDDFDRFCQERLEAYLRPGSEAPADDLEGNIQDALPEEVRPHYRELSSYGSWQYVTPYGWVWHPVYTGSWGPYWNGYWTWFPTGWIWVSYDPWGWAPYRYGRWDHVGTIGWVWIPGRVWRGAWVGFAVGRSHLGWSALNYYNRPVFHDVTIVNVVNVRAGRLNPRGWRFAPVGRIAERGFRTVRADRLPVDTEFVLSGRLPRFNPKDVARQPDGSRMLQERTRRERSPFPGASPDGKPKPFRATEGRETRTGPGRSIAHPRREAPRPTQAAPRSQGPATVGPDRRTPAGPRPGLRVPTGTPPPRVGRESPAPSSRPGNPAVKQGSATGPRRVAPPPPRPGGSRPGSVVEQLFEKARGERLKAQGRPGGERARVPDQPHRERPRAQGRPGSKPERPAPKPPPPPPRKQDKD